jgi:hypothetical protein
MEPVKNEKSLLYKLDNLTKYFDICYWRARRNGQEYKKSFDNC